MCVCLCEEIYYVELAYTIMEPEKSQDLQQGRDWGQPVVWFQSEPEVPRAAGLNSVLRASSLETQEVLIFPFMATGKKRPVSQLSAVRQEIP